MQSYFHEYPLASERLSTRHNTTIGTGSICNVADQSHPLLNVLRYKGAHIGVDRTARCSVGARRCCPCSSSGGAGAAEGRCRPSPSRRPAISPRRGNFCGVERTNSSIRPVQKAGSQAGGGCAMHAGILKVLAAAAMTLPLAVAYAPIGFGPGLSLAGPAFLPRRADVAARALPPLDACAPRPHARAGQLQPAKPTSLMCSSSLGRALNAGGSGDRAAVGFGALQTMRPLLLGATRVSRRSRMPLKAGGEPDPEKVRTCLPAAPPRAREGCVCHLRGNQLCSADPPQLRQGAGGPSSRIGAG